jgi:hypothetical protein
MGKRSNGAMDIMVIILKISQLSDISIHTAWSTIRPAILQYVGILPPKMAPYRRQNFSFQMKFIMLPNLKQKIWV